MCFVHILYLFGAISLCSGSSLLRYFIGHADCTGVPYGWLIKNPLDCGSYFVCEDEITYERCPSLLHFDAEKRVCNWPDKAKCDWTALPPIPIFPDVDDSEEVIVRPLPTFRPVTDPPTIPTTSEPTTTRRVETTSTTTTTRRSPTTTTTNKPTTKRPLWTIPPVTPKPVDMAWVCENVILKNTTVGEVPSEAGAFDKNIGRRVDPIETFNPKKVSCIYEGVYFLPHPTVCHNYYICSHGTLVAHSCGNGVSWNYITNQCDISFMSKCYSKEKENENTTKLPTPQIKTTPSTTEKVTRYVTPERPKTTLNEKVPVCPMNVQTYYPHSEDCRKYYICIAGLPVLTTCPDELYWDDENKFCGLPQYTNCKSKV